MTLEDMVQRVVRLIRHRDTLQREQWLQSHGWQVRKEKISIDGFEDPENPDIYDFETAFLLAQTRDIMRLLDKSEKILSECNVESID